MSELFSGRFLIPGLSYPQSAYMLFSHCVCLCMCVRAHRRGAEVGCRSLAFQGGWGTGCTQVPVPEVRGVGVMWVFIWPGSEW